MMDNGLLTDSYSYAIRTTRVSKASSVIFAKQIEVHRGPPSLDIINRMSAGPSVPAAMDDQQPTSTAPSAGAQGGGDDSQRDSSYYEHLDVAGRSMSTASIGQASEPATTTMRQKRRKLNAACDSTAQDTDITANEISDFFWNLTF